MAKMNMIAEVKIVETSTDCIVFLARDNEIIHPPRPSEV